MALKFDPTDALEPQDASTQRLDGWTIEPWREMRGFGPIDPLPLIAVAGSRGKSTVSWMLQQILAKAGRTHASWLSSGVYVDSEPQEGELGPWSKVVMAARYGELSCAIQEMIAPTVIATGLPAETYPLVVLTTLCGNNEACRLSPETIIEHKAMTTVVQATRSDGSIVVNADDFDVVWLANNSGRATIMYALNQSNPALQQHLQNSGWGAWLHEGRIWVGDSAEQHLVISVERLRSSLSGTILFQVQNALAAAATAVAIGVPLAAIASGLAAFLPVPNEQPAACNVLQFNGATILVDAPTRIMPLRLLIRGIRHRPHRRTIIVSGMFPGFSDDELVEAGRLLGGLGGIIVLHGGEQHPQRAELIKEGIAAAQRSPIVMSLPSERKATDQMLNVIGSDDIALVLAADPAEVLDHLWPAPKTGMRTEVRAPSKAGD